ncbi:MAG TPA: DUF983 domain-containing protein [Magnetospirillaceae bacterium]
MTDVQTTDIQTIDAQTETLPGESHTSRWVALRRGLMGRCPNCGKGKLLSGYLKIAPRCANCGETYGHLRADDGPAWVTIIVVGHLVVPIALIMEQRYHPQVWIQEVIWLPVVALLSLALLPRSKGLVLALLWSWKAEGSDQAT